MLGLNAARAYRARSADRNVREQEADVFRRATAALRQALSGSDLDRVRALADNKLLWRTVVHSLRDPSNALPASLKGSIISVGLAVQRELEAEEPDLPFVINVNEQIAAGLMSA